MSRLRDLLSSAEDLSESSQEIRAASTDAWGRSQLSASRGNVLRWIDWTALARPDAPVLETDAEAGAVTRFLGESGCLVHAFSGSKLYAELAHLRCRDLPNVRVHSTPFEAAGVIGRYGVAVVVETVGSTHDSTVWARRAFDASCALKEGGVLLLAVRNGVWHGDASRSLASKTAPYAPRSRASWSKVRWCDYLRSLGLHDVQVFHLWPDHVYTSVLFNGEPPRGYALGNWVSPDSACLGGEPLAGLGARLLGPALDDEGFLGLASPSLLFVGRRGVPSGSIGPEWLACTFAVERAKPFWTKTELVVTNATAPFVRKTSLCPDRSSVHGWSLRTKSAPWFAGPLLAHHWAALILRGDVAAFLQSLVWYRSVLVEQLGTSLRWNRLCWLKREAVDAIPQNLVLTPDGPQFIDLEWHASHGVTEDFVVFRALTALVGREASWVQLAPLGLGQTEAEVLHRLLAHVYPDLSLRRLHELLVLSNEFSAAAHGSRSASAAAVSFVARLPESEALVRECVQGLSADAGENGDWELVLACRRAAFDPRGLDHRIVLVEMDDDLVDRSPVAVARRVARGHTVVPLLL